MMSSYAGIKRFRFSPAHCSAAERGRFFRNKRAGCLSAGALVINKIGEKYGAGKQALTSIKKRVPARAEKSVCARVAEGQAARAMFLLVLFFAPKKST
jgi:hypothetical protein